MMGPAKDRSGGTIRPIIVEALPFFSALSANGGLNNHRCASPPPPDPLQLTLRRSHPIRAAMTERPYDDRDGWIWFDGRLVPWREAGVHILTHALHYASSVF